MVCKRVQHVCQINSKWRFGVKRKMAERKDGKRFALRPLPRTCHVDLETWRPSRNRAPVPCWPIWTLWQWRESWSDDNTLQTIVPSPILNGTGARPFLLLLCLQSVPRSPSFDAIQEIRQSIRRPVILFRKKSASTSFHSNQMSVWLRQELRSTSRVSAILQKMCVFLVGVASKTCSHQVRFEFDEIQCKSYIFCLQLLPIIYHFQVQISVSIASKLQCIRTWTQNVCRNACFLLDVRNLNSWCASVSIVTLYFTCISSSVLGLRLRARNWTACPYLFCFHAFKGLLIHDSI